MLNLVVVSSKKDWPENLPNARVLTALEYLMSPEFQKAKKFRVYNLCRSYRYQSNGYYVSLLAEARGHRPNPSVSTIEDFKSPFVFKMLSDDFDELIQKSLSHIKSDEFQLSIYFGKNMSKHYERLCSLLYNSFRVPLLRAHFKYTKDKWFLKSISPIAYKDVPDIHREFLLNACENYFARPIPKEKKRAVPRYELAILHNPDEVTSPSNKKALEKFIKAGSKYGLSVELITKNDYGKISTFDALFIRETTNVNHHTFRFARRAETEGLVVIDDSLSILKCSNKVFLDEILGINKIPHPKTVIVSEKNIERAIQEIQLPCVLKEPDSSFSKGVVKVKTLEEYVDKVKLILEKSDLVLVQQFLPTDFDWRVGIIENRAIFVCKYFMAKNHWQIRQNNGSKGTKEGKAMSVPIAEAPPKLIEVALKAASLIGNGLYGVDVKESNGEFYVIEINDNPNIDHGVEDVAMKDELYEEIMKVFIKRIEKNKGTGAQNHVSLNSNINL